ncbi:unnamed protein product [Withania somnifera]
MAVSIAQKDPENVVPEEEDDEESPIEQVRLTVSNEDDPSLPVWTFLIYRAEPLVITMITVQVASLPIGRIMARCLSMRKFKIGSWEFSLNPGPFNMKEHVLISIFTNAGSAFGNGPAYAVGIVLGYGWAGILRKVVVDPAEMWWPSSLVQVSLFRGNFFLIVLACSFIWYMVPGFLFPTLSNLSLLCLAYPKSLFAQQLGSGMKGLEILSFTFDWAVIASYLGSPLVYPFFIIANVIIGYIGVVYILIPLSYWGLNLYNPNNFPLFSSELFDARGRYIMLQPLLIISLRYIFMKDQVQLTWWGLLIAALLALIYTLPISIITAITNMLPGLNVIREYVYGLIAPGKPIANAVSVLQDFKLGHYMKVPPRSMSTLQLVGTILGGTINMGVAWWRRNSIEHICQPKMLHPNSPWTRQSDIEPLRIFLGQGEYSSLSWCFVGGLLAPFLVWEIHKSFPSQSWIKLINLPLLLAATASMPPATILYFNSWIIIWIVFNFFIFRHRKYWWQRHNYFLSAALDAGVALMEVVLFFCVTLWDVNFSWWGTGGEYCDFAHCPTGKGISVDGCPLT